MSNRKYMEAGAHPHPHIGHLIYKVMREKRFTKAEMARRLDVSQSVFSKYLHNSSVQFGILWKISLAMNYDFLGALQAYYPAEMPRPGDEEKATLKKEIEIYKSLLQRP